MSVKKKTIRRKQVLFAVLAAVAAGFAAVVIANAVTGPSRPDQIGNGVTNQDPQDEVQYGVVYDCGAGKRKFKVISCEGDEDMDQCKVQTLRDAGTVALEDNWYRKMVTDALAEGCKPKQDAKKKAAARPQAQPEPESEVEEKPAPKPKPTPKTKPVSKPTPEPEAEPVEKLEEPEPKNEDDAASAEPAPAAPGPQFSIGDCVQIDGGKGLIKRADGENFYVETESGTKRVPFSSASKLKKATGCGG